MALFSFLKRPRTYDVQGPQGGIDTRVVLPEGFDPAKDRCPMVILMHGFMARKSMYPITALAKALAAEGIASLSFDFDAHGKSEGAFIDMTLSNEVADARAVWEYARQLPYVSRIALAGHSQGGVIAGILAGELEAEGGDKPACLVQLAPAAVLKDDALKGQCMNAKYDPANPPEYVNVFFHKLGRKFILEAQQYPIYEKSTRYTGKVCLIHGARDKIVPLSYSRKYDELYADSKLHILEKEGHFLGGDKKTVISLATSFLKENA
ncbi:MAG: alpha/beta fold hydrolase [Bacteroidales bacterium]|nr:alpha/beta fold hydrolase [Bacteroidales bacterium]